MPSKELIAKVAEAIIDNPPNETMTDDEIVIDWSPTAKAALSTILAALQEPTEGMIEAGCDQYDFGDQITQGEILAKEWRAMLAASALGEQSE
ncbi:hypothetical protein [Brucella tritici]|uniref:hypothetical protein n=1 Tax=Brucella tritici TaxID=94626 RepID=UPI002001A87F|nr:hypothetical protein [Brucella tritici]